jgi:predicted aspartyl protease
MGEVRVNTILEGPKGKVEIKNVLIDTGTTYTVLPKEKLEQVGAYYGHDTEVKLGNRERIKAEIYGAILHMEDRRCFAPILTFENAEQVVGQLTLEALGLKVDLTKGKLEPTREANLAYFFIQKLKR